MILHKYIQGSYFVLIAAFITSLSLTSCEESSGEIIIKDYEAQQTESIELSDKSAATLRGGAKLRYPNRFEGASREVGFLGEGFFKIENKKEPFLINIEHGQISSSGGHINIRTHANDVFSLKVQEGNATFTPSSGQAQNVSAGQAFIYYIRNKQSFLIPMNPSNMDSWIDNTLEFDSSPFYMVVVDLNEHYGSNIQIEQDVVKNCSFSGRYVNKSLDDILEEFRNVFWLDGIDHFDTIIALRGGACRN